MTKYYKRGIREFYAVSPERVIRVVVKAYRTEITIQGGDDKMGDISKAFIIESALEGQEITREEFAEQFKVASRLIVMEP